MMLPGVSTKASSVCASSTTNAKIHLVFLSTPQVLCNVFNNIFYITSKLKLFK